MSDLESRRLIRFRDGRREAVEDRVVVEEPLEIRVAGAPLVVVMRTPGRDDELAAGFLFSEGLVPSAAALGAIRHCRDPEGNPTPNVVDVIPPADYPIDLEGFRREFLSASSCGICGKTSIEQVRRRVTSDLIDDPTRVRLATLLALPERLRASQTLFASAGSLHAAGLFDAGGSMILLREDVGRHNAVDRVVGRMLIDERLPLAGRVLLVSGRISFEIVQKAAAAGIPVVAAISGASSLAITLAETCGLTLIGFVRAGGANVYCGAQRVE